MKKTFEKIIKLLPPEVLNTLEYNYSDDNKKNSGLEILNDFLHGDLDLRIANAEGCTIKIIGNNLISQNPKTDCEIIKRIADLMDSDEHMALFKKHGLFHDGGDDFDYSGSFYYDLLIIMGYAFNLDDYKSEDGDSFMEN